MTRLTTRGSMHRGGAAGPTPTTARPLRVPLWLLADADVDGRFGSYISRGALVAGHDAPTCVERKRLADAEHDPAVYSGVAGGEGQDVQVQRIAGLFQAPPDQAVKGPGEMGTEFWARMALGAMTLLIYGASYVAFTEVEGRTIDSASWCRI
jgi:hypothetical protein